jgi:hypothetical protein
MSSEVVPAASEGYAQRIARNEAALLGYRSERADRSARGVSTNASDRVIGRLEAETTLLRGWVDRDARAAAR